MKIKNTIQIESNELMSSFYDAVIVASGYESRASYMVTQFRPNGIRKYAISFNSFKNVLSREKNDKIFESNSYDLLFSDEHDSGVIDHIIKKIAAEVTGRKIRLLIDYSCMTRLWYSTIIQYFVYNQNDLDSVELTFSYTPSKYVSPPDEFILNHFVEPLEGFSNISIPDKPTALVIGLGYIPTRAFGLTEYFDAVPFLFYSDSSFNNMFSDTVKFINKELIDSVKKENIFNYPLRDLTYTESILINLCKDLKDSYRIIIAPCGPKPFTLLSLITAIRLSEIDVWRISAGSLETPIDKEHDNGVLLLKVNLEN